MTEEELFRKLGGFNPINNFGAPKENIAINPFTGKPIVSNAGQLATSMTRGIPQLATGVLDLAGLPFTMSGLLDDKDVFGSTAYLDSKGLLPPKQTGTGNMLAEMGSSMINPPLAAKGALLGLAGMVGKGSKLPTKDTVKFDPRFDDRVREQVKLENVKPKIQSNNIQENVPQVSLTEFEGRPFITSMADRTRADGVLTGIGDVNFNYGVDMLGGQGYPFLFPKQQWASGELPVRQMDELAKIIKRDTGQNPIHIPWRMAPTGGDFSHMTGETMIAYADAAMPLKQKKKADKLIKSLIPEWKGMSDPNSVIQYSEAPDAIRKEIQQKLDVEFRNLGGLGRGEARLAVSDPNQLNAIDGGIQNVGEFFADSDILFKPTQHRSYPYVLQGEGIGQVKSDKTIFELLDLNKRIQLDKKGKPTGKIITINKKNPTSDDLRSLQMKPYSGTITEGLLKKLGY
tara:strand:+ start:42 stop:1412 length:1371 start_codon:yes stop_codon:yes gene_type:complete